MRPIASEIREVAVTCQPSNKRYRELLLGDDHTMQVSVHEVHGNVDVLKIRRLRRIPSNIPGFESA